MKDQQNMLTRDFRLLRKQQSKPLLDCNPFTGVLILRRKPGWMGRQTGVSLKVVLLECIHAFAVRVQVEHQMHRHVFLFDVSQP